MNGAHHDSLSGPFGARSGPRRPSVLRRVAHLALAVVLGTATLLVLLLGGVAKGSAHTRPPTAERGIWVGRPSSNGPITTSAGVSSGIPASLHVMQQLAGTAEAAKVSQQVRYPGWTVGGATEIPVQHFARSDAGVGLGAVMPWFQPTLAVGLADGIGEIDTAALTDVYSYASAAHLIPVSTESSITTAHGVVLLTTPAASLTRQASRLVLPGAHSDTEMAPALRALVARQDLPVTPLAQNGIAGFDAALTDLASSTSAAIGRSTAKLVDYPTRPTGQDSTAAALRAPLLFALAIVLAVAVGMIPTLVRVLRRRHHNRQQA